jgi:hypothetical protein
MDEEDIESRVKAEQNCPSDNDRISRDKSSKELDD